MATGVMVTGLVVGVNHIAGTASAGGVEAGCDEGYVEKSGVCVEELPAGMPYTTGESQSTPTKHKSEPGKPVVENPVTPETTPAPTPIPIGQSVAMCPFPQLTVLLENSPPKWKCVEQPYADTPTPDEPISEPAKEVTEEENEEFNKNLKKDLILKVTQTAYGPDILLTDKGSQDTGNGLPANPTSDIEPILDKLKSYQALNTECNRRRQLIGSVYTGNEANAFCDGVKYAQDSIMQSILESNK